MMKPGNGSMNENKLRILTALGRCVRRFGPAPGQISMLLENANTTNGRTEQNISL